MLILDLSFMEGHEEELATLNQGKVGPPYRLTPRYIQLLAAVRYLYGMPYRQLEGFTRSLHKLASRLPSADYSGLRKRILALNPDPYRAVWEFLGLGYDGWAVGCGDGVLHVQAFVWGAQPSKEYGLHREGAGGQGIPLQHAGEHMRRKKRERK